MWRNSLSALLVLTCLATTARAEDEDGDAAREKAHLLQLQADIYRLNVEADYAAALKKLCDTGYGDPALCRRPGTAALQAAAPESASASEPLPTVAEISGFAGRLAATLVYPDGTRLQVSGPTPSAGGSRLKGGDQVVAIRSDRVEILRKNGQKLALAFKQPPPPAAPGGTRSN